MSCDGSDLRVLINPRNLAAHPPGRDAPTAKPSSLPRCALVAPLTSPAENHIQHAIENVKHGCFAFHRMKLAWGRPIQCVCGRARSTPFGALPARLLESR